MTASLGRSHAPAFKPRTVSPSRGILAPSSLTRTLVSFSQKLARRHQAARTASLGRSHAPALKMLLAVLTPSTSFTSSWRWHLRKNVKTCVWQILTALGTLGTLQQGIRFKMLVRFFQNVLTGKRSRTPVLSQAGLSVTT